MRIAFAFAAVLLPAVLALRAQTAQHTLAEQYLYASVNSERAANGLPPLRWSSALQAAADFHAQRMRATGTLSHQLSGEPDLSARAFRAGASFSRVAENVAVGQSILQMHDALMRSPHHRENILDPAVDTIAVAVVADRGQLWAVEDFAHAVEHLSLGEQEQRVAALLSRTGLPVEATENARATCGKDTGYVGARPGFVMRYTTADLHRLPEQLLARLQGSSYRTAAVGACPVGTPNAFTTYNLAVLLYR